MVPAGLAGNPRQGPVTSEFSSGTWAGLFLIG